MSNASVSSSPCMPLIPALEALRDVRTDEIVVTTMGSAREWPKLSQHPLDLQYLPSAMGHSTALALGLALARPERRVIAITGDGGLLMSLGNLVTVVAARAENLTIIVLDNGLYEVTGGQATAAAEVSTGAAPAACDFAAIATAAGFPTSRRYDELSTWQPAIPRLLSEPGPRFIQLRIAPIGEAYHLPPPTSPPERLKRFQTAL